MKKPIALSAFLILAVLFNCKCSAQSKKIVRSLDTLVQELTMIKSTAEQEAADIKKNWSTTQNKTQTASSTTPEKSTGAADGGTVKKDSSNSAQSKTTIATVTDGLKKINDPGKEKEIQATTKQNEIGVSKTATKDPMKSVKDSLYLQAQKKYEKLQTSVAGLVGKFQFIIKNPKLINANQEAQISKDLTDLHNKLEDFQTVYYSGTMILLKGPKFQMTGTIIVEIVELGVEIYKQVKNLVAADRERLSNSFQTQCALKLWTDPNL